MHVNCGSPLSRDSTMLQHTVYRVIFVGGNCCEKWEEALRIKFYGVNFELIARLLLERVWLHENLSVSTYEVTTSVFKES